MPQKERRKGNAFPELTNSRLKFILLCFSRTNICHYFVACISGGSRPSPDPEPPGGHQFQKSEASSAVKKIGGRFVF